ncbi:diacylglycerol/lipid kinase family protein [Oecophyllibacter saccharovorans]|uniref:Diacylglycerol kinase n=1 Tax=Oecophyllibacter saccharovorans TaxID=2558360 RepID=A0A506UQJ5_9PROT|nr:diacylglycerol kinase [Oecophyllibacter saccharovorans]
MTERFLILLNPRAGRRRKGRLERFLAALRQTGASVELRMTEHAGHATALTYQALCSGKYGCIVAAGGDGTVAEVARGFVLAGTHPPTRKVRLGIWPLGTANVYARELHVPFTPQANARLLISGQRVNVWPGLIQYCQETGSWKAPPYSPLKQTEIFLQMVGAGFDAHCVHNVSTVLKARWGALAYLISASSSWKQFSFRPFGVVCDGQSYRATSAIVTKGGLYGGPFRLVTGQTPQSRKFTVLLLQGERRDILRLVFSLLRGDGCPAGVEKILAEEIVFPQPGVPLQSDGDSRNFTPCRITNTPSALSVAAPEARPRRRRDAKPHLQQG